MLLCVRAGLVPDAAASALETLASARPVRHLTCSSTGSALRLFWNGYGTYLGDIRRGGGAINHQFAVSIMAASDLSEHITTRIYVPAADPHVGDPLVRRPVLLARPERRVQQVVEVRVVAENHVAADIEQKSFGRDVRARQAAGLGVLLEEEPVVVLELVEARGGAEAARAGADDDDAHDFRASTLREA